jgi:7-cyano-7-deazaguanine synthase in queuosine biosynthesis
MPEYVVTCLPPFADRQGNEQLHFEIDGKRKGVSVRIGQLCQRLVTNLPDIAIDLIELAAFVYSIDASVSRGGLTDQRMAKKWHRTFRVNMPVRDLERWSDPALKRDLEETLMFLSGDRFDFTFVQLDVTNSGASGYFDFGEETSWLPDSILMFSGGLDSFAGALEEIVERKHKVALISHFSATKIAPVQRSLQRHMANKLGSQMLMHIPMKVQLSRGTNVEGTHRTRSFLFAALGMATTVAFGGNGVSFYENGVVSLNLPPVGNVLGTRATRTTHPQTLQRFERLFSGVFKRLLRVDNPFFWRTKTEVVETIARLGMADQIRFTRSCADVHNQTKQHPHCGRCSQCVDRRFAMLASGLEAHDPQEAYSIDLMTGSRERVQDREVALSYVRSAFGYEVMTDADLATHYPAILNAVSSLSGPPDTALKRISALLQRHGKSVTKVMRETLSARTPDQFPEGSLPNLYGAIQRAQVLPIANVPPIRTPTKDGDSILDLAIDRRRNKLLINGTITITGAAYRLLICLVDEHLRGAGEGLDLLDYPTLTARKLTDLLDLQDEAALRQSISRARTSLAKKFTSAGLDGNDGSALIENLSWRGYRLQPDRVKVRLVSQV